MSETETPAPQEGPTAAELIAGEDAPAPPSVEQDTAQPVETSGAPAAEVTVSQPTDPAPAADTPAPEPVPTTSDTLTALLEELRDLKAKLAAALANL